MKKSKWLTTRSLMACVVLGVIGAVFTWLAIALNAVLASTVAWLSAPPPLPFAVGSIIAALLIRKSGVAALTGLVTAIIGFGAMALLCALVVELAVWLGKPLLKPVPGDLVNKRVLIWSLIGGFAYGVGVSSGIFMVAALRDTLPLELLLLGSAVKIAIGVIYGLLSFLIVKRLFKAGINPQGLPLHTTPAPQAA